MPNYQFCQSSPAEISARQIRARITSRLMVRAESARFCSTRKEIDSVCSHSHYLTRPLMRLALVALGPRISCASPRKKSFPRREARPAFRRKCCLFFAHNAAFFKLLFQQYALLRRARKTLREITRPTEAVVTRQVKLYESRASFVRVNTKTRRVPPAFPRRFLSVRNTKESRFARRIKRSINL